MTVEEYMEKIQGSYGDYNDFLGLEVFDWLSGKNQRAIGLIYAETLKNVSTMYGKPPGIKELEDVWKIVKKERWMELETPNEDHRLIEEQYLPREEAAKVIKECLDKITNKVRYNGQKKP